MSALALAAAATVSNAAVDSTWVPVTGGAWNTSTPANWTAGVPSAAGDIARLSNDITSDAAVSITSAITVGALYIGDAGATADNTFTVSAGTGGSLTFQSTSGNAILTQTTASGVNNVVGAFALASDLDITAANGSQFTLNGNITGTGNINITTADVGRVYFSGTSSTYVGNLTISGGSVLLGAQGNALLGSTTNGTRTVTIQNNATLQLNGTLTLGSNRAIAIGTTGGSINLNSKILAIGAGQLTGSTPLSMTNGAAATPVTISGSNAGYTGTLSLSGGTTLVNLNAASAVGGDLSIGTGTSAVLGASGTIAAGHKVTLAGGTFNTSAIGTYTVASGQTINGTGTWTGSTTANIVAGLLSVGATHNSASGTASTLAVTGGALTLQGTSQFDLYTATTSDSLTAPTIDYGGILQVANPKSVALALGQSWQLFSGTRSSANADTFTNTFAYNDPNLPTLASTLGWSFNYATGTLSIVSAPEPAVATLVASLSGLMLIRRRKQA